MQDKETDKEKTGKTNIILMLYNITRNVNKKHIEEIFSYYGNVKSVCIPREEESNLNKNYAFIEFEDRAQAEKASLYMGGGQIDGTVVTTEILEPENYIKRENIKQIERQRSRSRSRKRSVKRSKNTSNNKK